MLWALEVFFPLIQGADILEKYGIASVIDVSERKQADFDALHTLGLKSFVLMPELAPAPWPTCTQFTSFTGTKVQILTQG